MSTTLPSNASSLSRNGAALVTHADGAIDGESGTGLYSRDTRRISRLQLTVNGLAPTLLSRSRTGVAEERLAYAHYGAEPDPQAIIRRDRSINTGYHEELHLRCFRQTLELTISIDLEADDTAVYELAAARPRPTRGSAELVRIVQPGDFTLEGATLTKTVVLSPGSELRVGWGVQLDQPPYDPPPTTIIRTTSRSLQRAVHNALWDLDALTIVEPTSGMPFVAAGSPHFLAAFGRDAIVASLLTMTARPDRALDTLNVLATHQGTSYNSETLEEPGRILHELRIGEMGVFGLEPGVPYYGSVDSTPLFVVLLVETLRWGCDIDRIRRLMPAARAAVQWCRTHVDANGFIQSIPHSQGIGNQGWKDSGDAIVRPNGDVISEATSLVEVQGYYHEALVGLAELEDYFGDHCAADSLRLEAKDLYRRFHSSFPSDEPAVLALALDSDGQTVDVCASNVGHLLATELIDQPTAQQLATRLVSGDEFTGWGIRTLSAREAAYNPLGYHLGSVWPHDTAMFLRGLRRRGFDEEAHLITNALVDLADELGGQLPELLGGFSRFDFPSPVPYPASARPQAWAASVPIEIVSSKLGIRPLMHQNRLCLRPRLETGETIVLEDLHLGPRSLRITATGGSAVVDGDVDGLEVVVE